MNVRTALLTPGKDAAQTSEFVVPQGRTITIGIYTEVPTKIPGKYLFEIFQVTSGAPNSVDGLRNGKRTTQLLGPGTYYITRPKLTDSVPVGIFSEE